MDLNSRKIVRSKLRQDMQKQNLFNFNNKSLIADYRNSSTGEFT